MVPLKTIYFFKKKNNSEIVKYEYQIKWNKFFLHNYLTNFILIYLIFKYECLYIE